MKSLKIILVFTLSCFLAACANVAEGPMYSPVNALKPGETGIYVYTTNQPYRYIGTTGPELYVDEKLIGSLPNHGYFYMKLPSGPHKVSVKYTRTVLTSRTNELPFNLGNKQIKYFEGRWGKNGRQYMLSDFTMHDDYEWRLVEVPEHIGDSQVKQLPLAK